jgi:myo-inositol-1(or 4)-monophosphatase
VQDTGVDDHRDRSALEAEQDHGWPAWGREVQAALDRRGITVNSAATRLGLRNTTLKRWLAGEVPPQLSRLGQIAELTGVSHAVQLELGNVLPRELRSEAHAMQVADELRGAIGEVADVLGRATELAFSDAGARLAGILLADSEVPLQVTLRRAYRGNRYPIHLSTYVGVEGIGSEHYDDEALRRQVTKIIGQSARVFGARWREQEAHDWAPPRPKLILNVPQHERPRPSASNVSPAVPNLLMLGCPYAHAEYIGALLADALGYGYIDVRYSVPLPLDRTPTDPVVTDSRVEFSRHLAADESLTRHNVWSLTDHRVLPEIMLHLREAPVGCAIYVRSDDRLLERGSQVWGVPLDEMVELRSMLDELITSVEWPILTVLMPDELLSDSLGEIESNRLADVAMLAAVDAWIELHRCRFVPDAIRGRLASMFDARGRPSGDPRLSMVRTQANTPRKRLRPMVLTETNSRSLLDLAIRAARDAGDLVRQVPGRDLRASTKSSPTDFVTEMDSASETMIRQTILGARPDDGIIGEEGTSLVSRSGVSWLVDPIDGTTNYLRGMPNYSVSIAAIRSNETLVGVVYDPSLEETFSAINGQGAALNGQSINCSTTLLQESIIGTGFSYLSSNRTRQAEILRTLLPCIGDIRRPGSAAVSLCWVACGRLDAFYEKWLQPWDYAAGALIAREAGADVLGAGQKPLQDRLIVASAPSLTIQLREILSGSVQSDNCGSSS